MPQPNLVPTETMVKRFKTTLGTMCSADPEWYEEERKKKRGRGRGEGAGIYILGW